MSELRFTDQAEEEPNLPDGEKPPEVTPDTGTAEALSLEPTKVRQFYTDLFFDMFVETLDIDMAFHEAKETFIGALVAKGIQVNADNMVSILDLMKDRAIRVASLKRMTQAMGLQSEYDKLLELELSYFASKFPAQGPNKSKQVAHPVAQGEKTNE